MRNVGAGVSNARAIVRPYVRARYVALDAEAESDQFSVRELDPVGWIVANAPHYHIAREDQRERGAAVVSPIANLLHDPRAAFFIRHGSTREPLDAWEWCAVRVQGRSGLELEIPFGGARNTEARTEHRACRSSRFSPPVGNRIAESRERSRPVTR